MEYLRQLIVGGVLRAHGLLPSLRGDDVLSEVRGKTLGLLVGSHDAGRDDVIVRRHSWVRSVKDRDVTFVQFGMFLLRSLLHYVKRVAMWATYMCEVGVRSIMRNRQRSLQDGEATQQAVGKWLARRRARLDRVLMSA